MSNRPYLLAETTWKTVKDTNYEVAVLPWGATEAHNYHLPFGTDIIESDYLAAEAARLAWEKGAKVVVLPTIPYGVNTGQLDIKLTINMNPSSQAAVLRDVIASLSGQGISKLMIMNSHGGNDFRQMIREIQSQYSKIFVCTINWYQIGDSEQIFQEPGDHAGEMETSLMLHLVPNLVLPLSEAGDGTEHKFKIHALHEKWAWAQREWRHTTKDTGIGNPAKATAEKGKQYFTELTEQISHLLIEIAVSDINDLYE